jgi:hypothetical protein
MAFSQISTSVTIINSGLKGYIGLSLTNFTSTAVSAIASGSAVEIAGAFFLADADITINASSWTAITTATTCYLALTPSGTAGSQTLAAAWTATAPVWSTSKQGWYATAASSVRVVASAYKDGPTTSASSKKIIATFGDYYNGTDGAGLGHTIGSKSNNLIPADGSNIAVSAFSTILAAAYANIFADPGDFSKLVICNGIFTTNVTGANEVRIPHGFFRDSFGGFVFRCYNLTTGTAYESVAFSTTATAASVINGFIYPV